MKCKLCNSEMKMRLAKQGKNAGNNFWGCSDYPNCKGVQDATEEDVREYNNAQAPKTATTGSVEVNLGVVRNESQSSYEFGKATNRHKIYYDTVVDLKSAIDDLIQAGFIENDLDALTIKPEDLGKENE